MKNDCFWIKPSPSLSKGIETINKLDESKFEQFLRRIASKLKRNDTEVFTEAEQNRLEDIFQINKEQLLLAIKTITYILKRALKYIFMPTNLKSDLLGIGISEQKVSYFVKIWSAEITSTLQNITPTADQNDNLKCMWKLNSELSSDYHKRCKVPKAYLNFNKKNANVEIELIHSELHSIFLQLESIQMELDNIL